MATIKDVFNEIAASWYGLRHWTRFRSELDTLAQKWQSGTLLNIGCAHGPDFLPFTELSFALYGIDISPEMLRFARKYAAKFNFPVSLAVADAVKLPFRDGSFDWMISVAAFHHIMSPGDREAALSEVNRVLKPGGEAFITVWNRWQPRFWGKGREINLPWHSRDRTLYRYHYLFSYGELNRLARRAGLKVIKSYPESSYRFPVKMFSRNICLLVRKDEG